MLQTFIAIVPVAVLIIVWIISVQRKLAVLDENVGNAMTQIGVQLASRFDALMPLLHLVRDYAGHESEALVETIKARSTAITARSTPADVLRQENLISAVLAIIAKVAGQYPELKATQTYIKAMDAVQTFTNMLRTSRLIYNDSVRQFNRELRLFPVSLMARMLGFRQKEYLVDQIAKADMPRTKLSNPKERRY